MEGGREGGRREGGREGKKEGKKEGGREEGREGMLRCRDEMEGVKYDMANHDPHA